MKIIDLYEAREDHIAQQQGKKIMAAYQNDTGRKPQNIKEPVEIVKAIAVASPKHIQWLTNLYIRGAFKLEDVGQVGQRIQQFLQLSPQLEASKRDLNKYTLPQVYEVIRSFEEKKVQDVDAHRAKGEQFVQKQDAIVIYHKGNVSVVIPKTKECSRHFGANTEWCTAHKEDGYNYFDDYDNRGTLYIITAGDGSLYQAFMGVESEPDEYDGDWEDEEGNEEGDWDDWDDRDPVLELRDKDDEEVTVGMLIHRHPELKPALAAIDDHGSVGITLYKDMDRYSKKKQLEMVKSDPSVFEFLSQEKQTPETVAAYIKQSHIGNAVSNIRKDLRSLPVVVDYAIKHQAVELLPKEVIRKFTPAQKKYVVDNRSHHGWEALPFAETEEQLKAAIKHNINAMSKIDKDKQSEGLIEYWLNANENQHYNADYRSWEAIDDKFKTLEVKKRAAVFIPLILKDIPKEDHTAKLYWKILEHSSHGNIKAIFNHGNPRLLTSEMLTMAFASDTGGMYSFFKLGHDPKNFKEEVRNAFTSKYLKGSPAYLFSFMDETLGTDVDFMNDILMAIAKRVVSDEKSNIDEIQSALGTYIRMTKTAPSKEFQQFLLQHLDNKSVLFMFSEPVWSIRVPRDIEDSADWKRFAKWFVNVQRTYPTVKKKLGEYYKSFSHGSKQQAQYFKNYE